MNWNYFRLKIQILCIIKNITEDEIKKYKYSEVHDSLLALNLL